MLCRQSPESIGVDPAHRPGAQRRDRGRAPCLWRMRAQARLTEDLAPADLDDGGAAARRAEATGDDDERGVRLLALGAHDVADVDAQPVDRADDVGSGLGVDVELVGDDLDEAVAIDARSGDLRERCEGVLVLREPPPVALALELADHRAFDRAHRRDPASPGEDRDLAARLAGADDVDPCQLRPEQHLETPLDDLHDDVALLALAHDDLARLVDAPWSITPGRLSGGVAHIRNVASAVDKICYRVVT